MEEISGIETTKKDSFCTQKQDFIIKETIELINKKEPKILQFGCSFIDNSLILLKNEKYHITFIEERDNIIEIYKKHTDKISKSALNKTNFEDNTFDFTFNIDIINDIQNPIDIMKEMVRVTRIYGMVLLIFPNKFNIKNIINFNAIDEKVPELNAKLAEFGSFPTSKNPLNPNKKNYLILFKIP